MSDLNRLARSVRSQVQAARADAPQMIGEMDGITLAPPRLVLSAMRKSFKVTNQIFEARDLKMMKTTILLTGLLAVSCTTRQRSESQTLADAKPAEVTCSSFDLQPLSNAQKNICDSLRKLEKDPIAIDFHVLVRAMFDLKSVKVDGKQVNVVKRNWVLDNPSLVPQRTDAPQMKISELHASLQLYFDKQKMPIAMNFPMIVAADGAIMTSAFGSLAKVKTVEEISRVERLVQLTGVIDGATASEPFAITVKTVAAVSAALEKALVANKFPGIKIDDLKTKKIVLEPSSPSKLLLTVHSFEIRSADGGKIGDIEKGDLTTKDGSSTEVLGQFWSFPLSIN